MPIPKGFKERKLKKVRCAKGSIRTKVISKDRRLLICCPAGHWSAKAVGVVGGKRVKGVCEVGTKAYAMLERKK